MMESTTPHQVVKLAPYQEEKFAESLDRLRIEICNKRRKLRAHQEASICLALQDILKIPENQEAELYKWLQGPVGTAIIKACRSMDQGL
jgi:hypothetical protein